MSSRSEELRAKARHIRASIAADKARDAAKDRVPSRAPVNRIRTVGLAGRRVAPLRPQIVREFLSAFPSGEASMGELQATLGRSVAKECFLSWFDRLR